MPMTPDAKARREANRKARLADPILAAERKAQHKAARAKYKAANLPKIKAARREKRKLDRIVYRIAGRARAAKKPFTGCDGEGVGRENHAYVLFRMGPRELYKGGARLTTGDCLAFILDHPPDEILVSFAFEYDITKIFAHDTPTPTIAKMLAAYQQPIEAEPGGKRKGPFWTWIDTPQGRFGVNWLPRNHLKVCRPDPVKKGRALPGSVRTIFDTWGFFACSFLTAINYWGVGKKHWATIKTMKAERSAFDVITPEIRAYNGIECELLAEMMTAFRDACQNAGIIPETWNGSGKLAAAMFKDAGVLTAKELAQRVPPAVLDMAHAAYYGGRFEITRVGRIALAVTEHDINSAYPAAMLDMPCLKHGRWRRAPAAEIEALPDDALFVAPVRFSHPREQFLCGFAFRSPKDGRLKWPRNGNGVYWSPEIRSAIRLGASVQYRAGYVYEKRCDCKPLAFMAGKYRERKALGKLKGEPIKRGMNSGYGKFAQRIGEPPFANPVWAGIITAMTRAKLNDAIRLAGPRNVIMIATDAIYTIGGPLALDHGDGLGQWGIEHYPELFIVQPGLYWPPPSKDWRVKSRGLSAKFFEPRVGAFEAAWRDYAEGGETQSVGRSEGRPSFDELCPWGGPSPAVTVEFPIFVGLRIAHHWGKPEKAGQWIEQSRKISFDWRAKRGAHTWAPDRSHAILDSDAGDILAQSARYSAAGKLETSDVFDIDRMLIEAMPDTIELSAPFITDD